MTDKTLTVHLDTSTRANARLSLALKLARTYGAHLDGLFAVFEPSPREFYVMAGTANYYDARRTLRAEQRAAIERLLHAELVLAQIEGAWLVAESDPVAAVTQRGRTADLTIVGQTDLDEPDAYVADHFADTPAGIVLLHWRPDPPYVVVDRLDSALVFHAAGREARAVRTTTVGPPRMASFGVARPRAEITVSAPNRIGNTALRKVSPLPQSE